MKKLISMEAIARLVSLEECGEDSQMCSEDVL